VTAPFLAPCLVVLRAEFNTENPNRDKGADGWIGNAAHQKEVSDHNPNSKGQVLALDIDTTGPWPSGLELDDYVDFIISRCQTGEEDRIEYIIRNRKIYERKNKYVGRAYDGDDPHTNHAHFSARHDLTGFNDTGEWFMLSGTDKTWLTNTIRAEVAKVAEEVWDYPLQRPEAAKGTMTSAGAYQRYTDVVTGAAADKVIAAFSVAK
jgi:hypothetical protein